MPAPRVRAAALCLAAPLFLWAPPALTQLPPPSDPALLRLSNAASLTRMMVDSAGTMLLYGSVNSGTAYSIPAGSTALMWYARKAAFRAGYVGGTLWSDANIGKYSIGMGFEAEASGPGTTAIGYIVSATGAYSIALGQSSIASGDFSLAAGADVKASGDRSTAIGYYADTNGQPGSFAYGDGAATGWLVSTAPNQFSVRAAGGYRFFTNSDMTLGAQLGPGQTAWSVLSDRNSKSRFLGIDGEELLARIRLVPVSTWIYTDQPDPSVRHIGPMAQDWRAAFGLSSDATSINSGDFDGVNLAAVQALLARTDALKAENAAIREENAALRALVVRLEERMRRLEDEAASGSRP